MPAIIVIAVVANAVFYFRSYMHREYVIYGAQQFFATDGQWRGKLVLGPWAPALFWGSGAITKPVWRNAFNDRNIIARFGPAGIVSEPDEKDSNQAFLLDGVVLSTPPNKNFKIKNFELNFYEWPRR